MVSKSLFWARYFAQMRVIKQMVCLAAASERQVLLAEEAQPAVHLRPVAAWARSAPAAPQGRSRHPYPAGTGPGSGCANSSATVQQWSVRPSAIAGDRSRAPGAPRSPRCSRTQW